MISADMKNVDEKQSALEIRFDGGFLTLTKEFSGIVKATDKAFGREMTDTLIELSRSDAFDKLFSETPQSEIKNDSGKTNEELLDEVLEIAKKTLAGFEDNVMRKPSAYNGKFIVVGSEKFPNNYFTVGKIYDVKDGNFLDDKGMERPFCTDHKLKSYRELETLCESSYGIKIVEVKE